MGVASDMDTLVRDEIPNSIWKYMEKYILDHIDKDEVSSELIEMAEIASKLEDLISQIKATTYSPFQSDEMKIKFIRKEIQDAGF